MVGKRTSSNVARSPAQIAHDVAELLDGVAVRGSLQGDQMATLRELEAEWRQAGGDGAGSVLFRSTKAALGAIRVTSPGDRIYTSAYESLIKTKAQWRELACEGMSE